MMEERNARQRQVRELAAEITIVTAQLDALEGQEHERWPEVEFLIRKLEEIEARWMTA